MTIRICFLSLLVFILSPSFGQTEDSASIFQHKILKGYFICIRDTIPKTDIDVTSSRSDFLILFFDKLNDILIDSINSINLSNPGYTLISGGISYAIAIPEQHRKYLDYLKRENLFSKAHNYEIFNFDLIDQDLMKSDKKIISIFKGHLTVVGPFLPYIKQIDLARQDLYMYIPCENNYLEYVYSILH